jgi:hypothetical protein
MQESGCSISGRKYFQIAALVFGTSYAVFLSLFAIDAGSIIGTLIHVLPSFAVIGVLVMGIRNSLVGSILAVLLSAIFTLFFETYRHQAPFLSISMPLLIISFLFLLSPRQQNR